MSNGFEVVFFNVEIYKQRYFKGLISIDELAPNGVPDNRDYAGQAEVWAEIGLNIDVSELECVLGAQEPIPKTYIECGPGDVMPNWSRLEQLWELQVIKRISVLVVEVGNGPRMCLATNDPFIGTRSWTYTSNPNDIRAAVEARYGLRRPL